MATDRANLAEAVRVRRLGLPGAPTQQQAAAGAGISDTTWSLVENGGEVGMRSLTKMATYLGWPIDRPKRLLDGEHFDDDAPADDAPPWKELLDGQRRITELLEKLATRLEGEP